MSWNSLPETNETYPLVELPPGHDDDRGRIQELNLRGDLQVLTSRAGAVRGNHYHHQGAHYSYLASGEMEYHWRPIGQKRIDFRLIRPGEMFYTPPGVEHAMVFRADSVLVVVGSKRGHQEEYEADVTRVKLV